MDMIGRALHRLGAQLPGCLSLPDSDRYAAATAIWAKPVGPMPRAVVHCRTAADVQAAIRAARESDLALSVRGGGHDWAGRALCGGLVIDLSAMNATVIAADHRSARIAGGASALDVLGVTDPHGLAAVTGSCGAVGMAGFTLGGGYGPCIGRFGLALDNLLAAEVVLADGRRVTASDSSEPELFWALRGGGGNFGVVTAMHHRLHELPSIWSGMLLFPFAEAKAVLEGCAAIAASAPDELTVQLGILVGPDGSPMVMIVPTWCGPPKQGEARVAPFLKLGTVLASTAAAMSCKERLGIFAPHIVNGQRVFMETSWLPSIDGRSVDVMIQAMAGAVSPGCVIITHAFTGAASRVPVEATAFGLRRDHVLVEILATFADRSDHLEERRHREWAQSTRQAFDAMALPGGYPNLLARGDGDRAAKSYSRNAERLIKAKRSYDPANVFCSAIPLPDQPSDRQGSTRF
jgi:FAD/FMN-containing dehydrogenase